MSAATCPRCGRQRAGSAHTVRDPVCWRELDVGGVAACERRGRERQAAAADPADFGWRFGPPPGPGAWWVQGANGVAGVVTLDRSLEDLGYSLAARASITLHARVATPEEVAALAAQAERRDP